MMTRNVGTAYLGLLVLASGCDGWRTPSGPPASIDAELRQSLGGWGVVPTGVAPSEESAVRSSATGVEIAESKLWAVLSSNKVMASLRYTSHMVRGRMRAVFVRTAGVRPRLCGARSGERTLNNPSGRTF